MKKISVVIYASLMSFGASLPAYADNLPVSQGRTVGVIEYSRGLTSLQGKVQGSRIVSKGTRFNRNDIIVTGKRSFAMLKLADGTRLTLRPNSKFAVEEFNPSLNENASATLRLFRGGMRTVTGFISKYNRKGYKMKTPVATIGIRGTEFDARLCTDDCAKESRSLKKFDVAKPKVIGRLAFVRGKIAARNRDGVERKIRRGSPLYEGDMLLTGRKSYGVLAFKDKSRVSLQPRTQFEISQFKYKAGDDRNNKAIMGLLRGGLRAVTGAIGKADRRNYRMRTPVATIGIRGTGYDLLCQGSCIASDFSDAGFLQQDTDDSWLSSLTDYLIQSAVAQPPVGNGMFAGVWEGGIDIEQESGTHSLDAGQFAFVANGQLPVQSLSSSDIPELLRNNPAPRPDQVDIEEGFLSESAQADAQPGLYVSVYEGHVSMQGDGDSVEIGAGEAAFSNGDVTTRLDQQPVFQEQDSMPNPADHVNPEQLDQSLPDDQACTIG